MPTTLDSLETLFKALADATRLRILGLMVGGEICVCEIHEALRLPQPTVSRHLAYLRRAGLVDTRREGLWIHYRLARLDDTVLRTLTEIVTHTLGHVSAIAKDARRLERQTGCCVKKASAHAHLRAVRAKGQAVASSTRRPQRGAGHRAPRR